MIIFQDFTWDWQHLVPTALVTIIYLALIAIATVEPISELKKMTKEEQDDHEYERVVIDDDLTETMVSTDM